MEKEIGMTLGGLILVVVLSVLGTLLIAVVSTFIYIKTKGADSFVSNFKRGMDKLAQLIENIVGKEDNEQHTESAD